MDTTTLTQPMPGATLPTYSEIKGSKPFDWHAFLAKSTHSEEQWYQALALAGTWVTCACGNQCAALERDHRGQPLDELLAGLGEDFLKEILEKDVPSARRTLQRIEERAALLLTTQAALCNG